MALFVNAVSHDVKILTAKVLEVSLDLVAVVGQLHAHHRVAGHAQGHLHRRVGLGIEVGLVIGIGAAGEIVGTVNGDILYHIHVLAAAVVAVARVALGALADKRVPAANFTARLV